MKASGSEASAVSRHDSEARSPDPEYLASVARLILRNLREGELEMARALLENLQEDGVDAKTLYETRVLPEMPNAQTFDELLSFPASDG